MTKISKSPQRNTFQKEGYIQRAEEKGEDPNEEVLKMWENWNEFAKQREQDPAWQKDNLEWDLRSTDWILEKARASDAYAQNIYAALSNNEFVKRDLWPILKDQRWSCTWRHAGGIVADMQGKGDYIDWYCSGMGGAAAWADSDHYSETFEEWQTRTGYVPEGTITEEIENDLYKLGWLVVVS